MPVIACKSGTNILHFSRLQKYHFSLNCSTIVKTKDSVLAVGKASAGAIMIDLHDKKKSTNKSLSSSGSEYSWKHCAEERKTALMGTTATTYITENTLGGCTPQIQWYGRIVLSSASAISDMKHNGCLHWPSGFKHYKKTRGLFHRFNKVLRDTIVEVLSVWGQPNV